MALASVPSPDSLSVTVDGPALKKALALVKCFVDARNHYLPHCQGVKLSVSAGNLVLRTTNLDASVAVTVPAQVFGNGAVVVPHRMLAELVKKPSKSIDLFVTDDETLQVNNGATASLRTLNIDDWPKDPQSLTGNLYRLDLEGLKYVLPAIAKDDNRPMLTGVRFDEMGMIATDSYRMHQWRQVGLPTLLVPGKPLAAVVKSGGPATLYIGPDQLVENPDPASGGRMPMSGPVQITTATAEFWIRQIEGDFPNYKQLFPHSPPIEAIFEKRLLLLAIEQVKPIIRESTTPVRLNLEGDLCRVTVATQDVGDVEVKLPCKLSGTDLTIAFNPTFLTESVNAGPGTEVRLAMIDALKPAVLTDVGAEHGSVRLLMPVRVP